MGELKAHRIDNIISAYKIGKAFCMKTEEEVYIKSEADKVIEILERDIVKLKSSLKYLVVRGIIDGPVKKAVEDLLKEAK